MPLEPGTRLGQFEVLSPIASGGMGEVYKATDTRLNRTVAIKVLLSHRADQPQLRERFQREAETIASLNHPHICTLYDIAHQDGTDYLVMEHLEGETLAERLTKGPLPLDEVLQVAMEVSDGLDKAHRKGITHRDLKPANVMLTKEGAKILDFGLAKLQQETAEPSIRLSEMPTAPNTLTAEGTILGTLQYMAPEQVEGKVEEIDARSDIFSFGAMVYEMATGQKAFEGKTQASVMAKILEVDQPPMSSLQPVTPPMLDRVVKKCLAKEPDKRWQSAGDLNDELKWIAEGGSEAGVQTIVATVPAVPMWRRAMPLALALVVGAIITSLVIWNLRPAISLQPVSRVVVSLPPDNKLQSTNDPSLAYSPDGTHLAYLSFENFGVFTRQIYLRAMDSMETRLIPNSEGGDTPFFSPDGQWLGFFTVGHLQKVAVSGGAAVTLADVANIRGASWGPDDTIVFSPEPSHVLFQVSAAGGAPQQLTTLKEGETSHRWPHFLPDGKAVLFTIGFGGSSDDSHIAALQLDTGEQKVLIRGGSYGQYVPTGHLVYYRAGTLMAVSFDAKRLEVLGTPAPALEGVLGSPNNTGVGQFSFSNLGSLIYLPGNDQGETSRQWKMVWVDREGAEQPLPSPPHFYDYPRLSPDGQRVAVTILDDDTDVWIYDIPRETLSRLTFEGNNGFPTWTPDGERVTFRSNRAGGPQNLYWKLTDGSGVEERLTTSESNNQMPQSWSPDGQVLAFSELNPDTSTDIWVLPLEGERKPQSFLQSPYVEDAGMFSPDGNWLAYTSNESGRPEIYVQPYPGPGGKRLISTDGGIGPVWARNGRELFYRNGIQMMAVDTTTQPTFSAGTPRMLFEGRYRSSSNSTRAGYDITQDGQRFLMIKPSEQEASPTQINVVLNWFEELKERVPTGN